MKLKRKIEHRSNFQGLSRRSASPVALSALRGLAPKSPLLLLFSEA